ncbi:hypothetical protein SALBM135S_01389 [Streptomyces alboniger]
MAPVALPTESTMYPPISGLPGLRVQRVDQGLVGDMDRLHRRTGGE